MNFGQLKVYHENSQGVDCPQYTLDTLLKLHSLKFPDVYDYFQTILYPRFRDLMTRDSGHTPGNPPDVNDVWCTDVTRFEQDVMSFLRTVTGKEAPPYFCARRTQRVGRRLAAYINSRCKKDPRIRSRSIMELDLLKADLSETDRLVIFVERVHAQLGIIHSRLCARLIQKTLLTGGKRFNVNANDRKQNPPCTNTNVRSSTALVVHDASPKTHN